MSELLQELLEMGFPENRAQKALFLTNNKGLSEAIDWLTEHQDDPDIDDPIILNEKDLIGNQEENTSTLSLEEVKKKIQERREQKRLEEEKHEIESEKMRREMGKKMAQTYQERKEAREKMEALRLKKQKEEEKRALEELRAQIRREKEERLARQTGKPLTTSEQQEQPKVEQEVNKVTSEPKEYTECHVQVRLMDGSTIKGVFKPTDTIQDIANYVMNEKSIYNFVLMTTFPKKAFTTTSELSTTLQDAGLVPRGQLIASKK